MNKHSFLTNDRFFASHIASWGQTKWNANAEYEHRKLQKRVDVKILPRDECNQRLRSSSLGNQFVLPESSICAIAVANQDNNLENACVGDGGAALVCPLNQNGLVNYVQAGKLTFSDHCFCSYLDWH